MRTLSTQQRVILGVAVGVIVLMGTVPPWQHVRERGYPHVLPAGYAPIFLPPVKGEIIRPPRVATIRQRDPETPAPSPSRLQQLREQAARQQPRFVPDAVYSTQIDFRRLFLQWALVVVAAGASVILGAPRRSRATENP